MLNHYDQRLIGQQFALIGPSPRSHAPAWECIPGSPYCTHLQQSRHSGIVSSAGIPPVHRIVYISSIYWVLIYVFDFLPHHRFILYHLWMNSLLPELISSIRFMNFFVKRQRFQDGSDIIFIKIANQLFRCKGFKARNRSTVVGRVKTGNQSTPCW